METAYPCAWLYAQIPNWCGWNGQNSIWWQVHIVPVVGIWFPIQWGVSNRRELFLNIRKLQIMHNISACVPSHKVQQVPEPKNTLQIKHLCCNIYWYGFFFFYYWVGEGHLQKRNTDKFVLVRFESRQTVWDLECTLGSAHAAATAGRTEWHKHLRSHANKTL